MANRNKQWQTAHNLGVNYEAKELEKNGWSVLADHIPDYNEPPLINNHIPDIYTTKSGHIRVIEIETSLDDDHKQHTAFRRHCGQYKNRHFYGRLVDTKGRRIDTFN